MSNHLFTPTPRAPVWLLTSLASALLVACGGGGDSGGALAESAAQDALGTTLVATDNAAPDAALGIEAQASFHSAPVLLEAPDDRDALDPGATAQQPPRQQTVPPAQAGLATRQLTVQALQSGSRMHTLSAPTGADGQAAPMATGAVVATYSPAQIRAAYGLPALPAAGTVLSATQAAQLGAGQTIYIVNAQHNPNVAAELSAFNQKFGLPTCTSRTLATGGTLPLAAAGKTACELVVAYSTATGTTTNTAPGYNAGWATEIALDVQWAHATAPLARIVLIEAPDASVNSLAAAVKLANAMGPGVVSMSFGAAEGTWTASMETAFAGAGISYLAATGASGAAVSWP
ncbi:MAG: peptidase S53, partial [Burkholderiales bacterium PBB5]